MSFTWVPQSFLSLHKNYSWDTFKKDLLAGITIAVISIPLAMAFAIASGVTPDRGLFTAIIAGFLISALGGSRYQIGGPTGAFVIILYGVVQRTGYEGLAISSLIAAALILTMGLCKLGTWIKYVPHPLITGFTTGIAVVVFSSQIKDFFGLTMGPVPADFIEKWSAYFQALSTINLIAFGVSLGTLLFIVLLRKFTPKIPWGISAIVGATLVCYFFHLPIETIRSKFGEIPSHLPLPHLPSFAILNDHFVEIFKNALAIAFLGSIESLLSAVIADGMTSTRHHPNSELIGQGIANFASILFGGIPATGAIARTAANVKSGAQTPMAGMLNAVFLLAILMFCAPLVSLVPLSALSAVLVVVAWNMSEKHHFAHLLKAPRSDVLILLVAFFFTVFVDITVAIFIGMFLACLTFMRKMSDHARPIPVVPAIHNQIQIYDLQGPLFFGAADLFKNLELDPAPKVFILRMGRVPLIDASGMQAIREFSRKCQREHIELLLAEVQEGTHLELRKFGVVDQIGDQHIFSKAEDALAKAQKIASQDLESV